MKIEIFKNLKINSRREEQWKGFLLTFFDGIEAILKKRRRATYLVHLFEERLQKNEQKELLRIFDGIITQLQEGRKGGNFSMKASSSRVSQQIPSELDFIIKAFQSVSTDATLSRQAPKARATGKNEPEVDLISSCVVFRSTKEGQNGRK